MPESVLQFRVWRQKDGMRQCGNIFRVIPRKFRDEKSSGLPHCSREH
jgi:hypothetical protein